MTNDEIKKRLIDQLASFCALEDPNGLAPMDGRQAKRRIKAFLKQSGLTTEEIRNAFMQPGIYLGPFCELPEPLRRAFGASASFYDQEHQLTNIAVIRRFTLLPVWRVGNLFLAKYPRKKTNEETAGGKINDRPATILEKAFFRIGLMLTLGTFKTAAMKVLNRLRFTRFYRQPLFYALWIHLEIDIRKLSFTYIDAIPVHPGLGPVFQCQDLLSATVVLVGLDLLVSNGSVYFLEANLNPGIRPGRLRLYEGGDPIGMNLVRYAKSQGLKHIELYGPDILGHTFDEETEGVWRQLAEGNEISLKVVDYLFRGRSRSARAARLELNFPPPARTLMAMVRAPVSSSLSMLISDKGNLDALIESANRDDPANLTVLLPRRYHRVGQRLPLQNDRRFPNLIIKDRRKDKGTGIELYNVTEIPEGYREDRYIINDFIVPDRIKIGMDEFVYDCRCMILLTANGPVYLGAFTRRSGAKLGENLPIGKVDDIKPFVANISQGGRVGKPDALQDELCREASLAIGEVIYRFIDKKYNFEVQGRHPVGSMAYERISQMEIGV